MNSPGINLNEHEDEWLAMSTKSIVSAFAASWMNEYPMPTCDNHSRASFVSLENIGISFISYWINMFQSSSGTNHVLNKDEEIGDYGLFLISP